MRKCVFLIAGLIALCASTAHAFEPRGKVDCIAPSDPGGGWDFTCRSVGVTLEQLGLVPRSVQTINMAGAGGGENPSGSSAVGSSSAPQRRHVYATIGTSSFVATGKTSRSAA